MIRLTFIGHYLAQNTKDGMHTTPQPIRQQAGQQAAAQSTVARESDMRLEESPPCAELSLSKACAGRSYLMVSNRAQASERMHMDSLGLIPGEVIHVLFSNFSGLVVGIKGSRLALGHTLASLLTVRDFDAETSAAVFSNVERGSGSHSKKWGDASGDEGRGSTRTPSLPGGEHHG